MIPIHTGILILGSEVLSGAVCEKNAPFLLGKFQDLGMPVRMQIVAGDSREEILEALSFLCRTCDLVVMTGGLGPTFDDLTRSCLAEFSGFPLRFRAREFERVKGRYAGRRKFLPALRAEMCFPEGAMVFANDWGMAPGFGVRCSGKWIVALPGVPEEARAIFERKVIPFLKKVFRISALPGLLTVKVLGLTELEILAKLGKDFPPRNPLISCGIYPGGGEVHLRMRIHGENRQGILREVNRWKKFFKTRLKTFLADFSDRPFEELLICRLKGARKTLAACESVTGGWISKRLTDIPGASGAFRGSLVTYTDFAKRSAAGVDRETLLRHGAVSGPVAARMAESARVKFSSDWGLGITGLAGPSSAGSGHPVGTVFIAVAGRRKTEVKKFCFKGVREKVRLRASQEALRMVWEALGHGKNQGVSCG